MTSVGGDEGGLADDEQCLFVPLNDEGGDSGVPPTDAAAAAASASGTAPVPEEDDTDSHVIMAVDVKEKATVGCAYYVSEEQKVYLLKDSAMGGAEVLETRK